ncbi:hypothetical protein EX30DRAFT_338325 [Ascodesmis nigricans]|uniref:Uncharacterized protein n=1 Tax=Ascodesmis nigricans TaxID=341454 RepID=A0A4S2N3K3_9PEZI|nr:hypothetical protein EX30DRAFT_338325 [Ascodesmis nigricans]
MTFTTDPLLPDHAVSPVSPSSTTSPIAIPARRERIPTLEANTFVLESRLNRANEGCVSITMVESNNPLHDFVQRRRLPLNLVFNATNSATALDESPCSTILEASASSTDATPPTSPSPLSRQPSQPTVFALDGTGDLSNGDHHPGLGYYQTSWMSRNAIPGRPSLQRKVSSSAPSSIKILPRASRHHYRNSLRSLRNLTLLPGGIRISKETGDVQPLSGGNDVLPDTNLLPGPDAGNGKSETENCGRIGRGNPCFREDGIASNVHSTGSDFLVTLDDATEWFRRHRRNIIVPPDVVTELIQAASLTAG